jgi:hypothetical protein
LLQNEYYLNTTRFPTVEEFKENLDVELPPILRILIGNPFLLGGA